eukprot:6967789-Ditylum_brightwellii.AAC.1
MSLPRRARETGTARTGALKEEEQQQPKEIDEQLKAEMKEQLKIKIEEAVEGNANLVPEQPKLNYLVPMNNDNTSIVKKAYRRDSW